jgi:P-type E1-E2 ATPase
MSFPIADRILIAAGTLALAGVMGAWTASHPDRARGLARRLTRLPGPRPRARLMPRTPSVALPIQSLPAPASRRPVATDGLDEAQVKSRTLRGEVNVGRDETSRSLWSIVRGNVFTRFNGLLVVLVAVALWVGPPQDALFGFSILINTLIGMVQELRAKRILDRLVVVCTPAVRVVRGGVPQELPAERVVIDDVVELRAGDQVPVDGRVLAAERLEIDESLLTGESSPVSKAKDDEVLSGSLVVAGGGRVQAIRIGTAAYGRRLAAEARRFSLARSELKEGIDAIVAFVGWLAAPLWALLLARQLVHPEAGWKDAVRGSVAASEGMIPQGLVLLTSVALAVAVVRLGRRSVLVQELAAVETLARVDVLCLDKTGTLSTGRLQLEDVMPLGSGEQANELRDILAVLARAARSDDPTAAAIARTCPLPDRPSKVTHTVPFSSARRWSAATIEGRGTWVLGSPAVLLNESAAAAPARVQAERFAECGRRVLALGHAWGPLEYEPAIPRDLAPKALVVLREEVRDDARVTLQYLTAQGIAVKVISGDDVRTTSAIAREAGVAGVSECADGDELPSDPRRLADVAERCVVFGRVTPHRKRDLILALRQRGHVVAMIGDGINDVLALKDANLGIAVRTAAAAARAIARVVLLDGFAALPNLLAEGRRVIANVERSANLFAAKVGYILLLALAVAAVGAPFPLLPRQNTLAGSVSVGIPGFFLAMTQYTTLARSGFLPRLIRFSVPAACMGAAASLAAYGIARALHHGDLALGRTAATLTLSAWGLSLVLALPGPKGRVPSAVLPLMASVLVTVICVGPLRDLFALIPPPPDVSIAVAALSAMAYVSLVPFFSRFTRAAKTGS